MKWKVGCFKGTLGIGQEHGDYQSIWGSMGATKGSIASFLASQRSAEGLGCTAIGFTEGHTGPNRAMQGYMGCETGEAQVGVYSLRP